MTVQWEFDERQQIGIDFSSLEEVVQYDKKQRVNPVGERELLLSLGLKEEQTLIEFGSGTGVLTREAAKIAKSVISIDVSQAMLEYSEKRAKKEGIQNIEYHHDGFLSYRHSGKPVDFIVTKNALHHLPDFWKMIAFCRFAELLKSGGVLYLRDVVFSFPPKEYIPFIENWIEAVSSSDGNGWSRGEFESHVRNEFSTYSWVLERMIIEAGFKIKEYEYSDLKTYAAYTCERTWKRG